jgi:hypothetical protein
VCTFPILLAVRAAAVAAAVACLAPAASAAVPIDLAESYLFSPPGKLTALHAGVTYEATSFPFAVRITPPDSTWAGAQWKQNKFTPYQIDLRQLTCSTNPNVCAPPYFGWVAIGRSGTDPNVPPRALILVLAGFERTPSVAATVESLRTRGHGATYDPPTHVTLAGFPGVQLDGEIVGPKHVFVPFSPRTSKATGFADAIELDGAGHAFRFDVLDVRGRTVVVYVGSLVMSPAEFASFLPQADRILGSIRFPKGA